MTNPNVRNIDGLPAIMRQFDTFARTTTVRAMADAGITVAEGSFEQGVTGVAQGTVVYQESTGKVFQWQLTNTFNITAGTLPTDYGTVGTDWIDKSGTTLRNLIQNTYPKDYGYNGLVDTTSKFIDYLNGSPAFSYGKVVLGGGTDTQIPLSKSGNFSMLTINGINYKSNFIGGKPLKIPSNFPWNPGIQAFSKAYGEVDCPNFNIQKYDFSINTSISTTHLYVDPVNGNNFQPIPNDSLPNSGTDPLFPLKSVNVAFDRIASKGYTYSCINLVGGYYYDISSWGSRSPTSNIVVKRWIAGDSRDFSPIILSSESALTWTLYSGTTYRASRTGAKWVVDATMYNEYGDWLDYEKVSTLAECMSTSGSWYTDGTYVYVNRISGGIVNAEIHVMISKANAGCSAGTYTLYCEDIWFFGGSTGFAANSRTSGTSDTLVMNKCKFLYSAANGFENYGINLCITKDCVSAYTYDDGFSYHSNRDDLTQVCNSIEINNRTYRTGRTDTVSPDSSNGSTCHERNIVIRLGCSYEQSMGPVVADVGSCSTYNFCVSARESVRVGETPRKSSFLVSGSGSKQWLDNSQAIRSLWSLDAYNGGLMYVEDVNIDSDIEGIENISSINR